MSHNRSKAAEMARDTVGIFTAGRYENRAGTTVHVRHLLNTAQAGTIGYPPDEALPKFSLGERKTEFEVVNGTTLEAARKLVADGFNAVALNFASARNPGGGFLGGARAQEESLCRASGLYPCINGNAMYRHHSPMPGGWYTNYAIYSPAVPVIKHDDGNLLDEPYSCAFVTSPAVNVGAISEKRQDAIRAEMRDRVEKVLTIMAGHGHDAAVLGAWGCGVFKNDPEMIADLFADAFRGRFSGVFAKVVFAVLTRDEAVIQPFEQRFNRVT